MSERRALFLHKSLIGTCALVAIALLVGFYSVVHGAVDRAARQRLVTAAASVDKSTPAPARAAPQSTALLARAGN